MRDRRSTYVVVGALLTLIILGLLSNGPPTAGQDAEPSGFLPVIVYEPTRLAYFPLVRHEPTPTPTPTPIPTATPTPTPPPLGSGPNLLPNPSFEEGWYHPNGIPELQVPNQWILEWDEGYNSLAPEPWNNYVRPEVRVLSRAFLPPNEHDLFIWDGDYTVKAFKGNGALSYRLITSRYLEPGRYQLEINVFPDLVVGYTQDGQKIWASDPRSGEVRFTVDGRSGQWIFPTFGQKNTIRHTVDVGQAKVVRITVAFRGRWAIQNNGWFMDDWRLTRLPG